MEGTLSFVLTFAGALRLTEVLVGLALVQQSAEHVFGRACPTATGGEPTRWRAVFALRVLAGVLMVFGLLVGVTTVVALATGLALLARHDGPYNGGADRMTLLVLTCLALAQWLPGDRWAMLAFGYLAVQLVISYFMSGWVKLVNPDWRSGRALGDVFGFSAYPVSEALRALSQRPVTLRLASWGVIGFELAFPLALFTVPTLLGALAIACVFHTANALVFGLNRFVLAWASAFPALWWFSADLRNIFSSL